MRANADGSVTLRGRRRIHATEDEPQFWARYGHRENPPKPTHQAFCLRCLGGGKFLGRPGSTRSAEREATSHGGQYGHDVTILPARHNPGLWSSLARGARSGYHAYRAGRYASKAARHRQKASAFMANPRRRRAQQSDSTLLWLLVGFGVYLVATRAASEQIGYLPQPYGYWFNPQTSQLYLAGGDGRPPGAVPPWRLASEAEILNVVGP